MCLSSVRNILFLKLHILFLMHLEQNEVDKIISSLPSPEVLSGIKVSGVEFEKVITQFSSG